MSPSVRPFIHTLTSYPFRLTLMLSACLSLTACEYFETEPQNQLSSSQIAKMLPSHVKNSRSWASDIEAVFKELNITRNKRNICTVVAVIDQESNFVADPSVAGLGDKSLKELESRLNDKLGKPVADYFRNMLQTKPTAKDSFAKQIRRVRTERELDELYRQIFDYFSKHYKVNAITDVAKVVGGDIAERLNPITTLGSMQVHIDYATPNRRLSMNNDELRRDLYSQYGGLYYGIHRLMLYPADYEKPIYRFADYNSGMYSSRNASFQNMLKTLSGNKISLDGDLLLYDGGSVRSDLSQTERILQQLFAKQGIALTQRQIRSDLKKEKSKSFEQTETYQTVKNLYQKKTKKKPAYAIMPQVVISGPKLSQNYNTNWFASNVDKRYQRCMAKAKNMA